MLSSVGAAGRVGGGLGDGASIMVELLFSFTVTLKGEIFRDSSMVWKGSSVSNDTVMGSPSSSMYCIDITVREVSFVERQFAITLALKSAREHSDGILYFIISVFRGTGPTKITSTFTRILPEGEVGKVLLLMLSFPVSFSLYFILRRKREKHHT